MYLAHPASRALRLREGPEGTCLDELPGPPQPGPGFYRLRDGRGVLQGAAYHTWMQGLQEQRAHGRDPHDPAVHQPPRHRPGTEQAIVLPGRIIRARIRVYIAHGHRGAPVADLGSDGHYLRSIVTSEDLAGRGQQPGPDRRRVEDPNLVAEASQPVHGRPLVLERQRHYPPAVLAGRCRCLERGPGGRAEDLGNPGQRLRRGLEPDLEPGPAGLELGRPPGPEPGELEVRRPPEGLGQDAGAEHAPGPEHPDVPGPGHRHQVPGPRLVHQAKRPDDARACRHGPRRTGTPGPACGPAAGPGPAPAGRAPPPADRRTTAAYRDGPAWPRPARR